MNHDILVAGLEIGKRIDTRGVFYAPYNKLICIGLTDNAVVGKVSGHSQFWSQTRHYIPANVIVWQKIGPGHDDNSWEVETAWEKETGRRTKAVQAEGIAFAESLNSFDKRT